MKNSLTGTGAALPTPLNKDYSIDFESQARLIDYTIRGGIDYFVVMGTTGESPVFTWEEKLKALEFVIREVNERKPVVFGLGGNYTHDLINRSKDLRQYKFDAILSVSPYYSRPSQEGLIRHYTLLADAFPKPIILYNVPSRTGVNIEAETTLTLSSHENIVAIKEASSDARQIRNVLQNKPEDFLFLSGNDGMTLQMIQMGAEGVISVIGNILPDKFTEMVSLALNGNALAEKYNSRLKKAYELLDKEGNPTSLKTGLNAMGICEKIVKPPLYEGSDMLRSEWKSYLSEIKN